ncbi:MAG: DUF4157 domain-containing protein [Anaerolineales bacterium]|nr:DUF4157 domain-containing protein [Anaerolineales bacterium]
MSFDRSWLSQKRPPMVIPAPRGRAPCEGDRPGERDPAPALDGVRHDFSRLAERSPDLSGEAPGGVQAALQSPGQPLEADTRAFLEPRFGQDLSRVRIHADARAARSAGALNALAYTVGRDIVFSAGQYRPDTLAGRKLLAHELAHVLQQGGAVFQPGRRLPLAAAEGPLERQAEAAGSQMHQGSLLAAGGLCAAISIQRAIEDPASPAGGGTTAADDLCAGWFSDRQSLTKRAAEHYVHTELTGDRGGVERIDCDLFAPSGAYACTAQFSDGTPIRVIARRDVIIVSLAPIQSMYPPPDRPLCWYDYRCPGPNRELTLTKRKCQSARPAGSASPASGPRGPQP